jgi:short-subunit dehydrogenase
VGCDLTDPAQLARGLAEIKDFLTKQAPTGGILLVNNSGFGLYGHFPDPGAAAQVEMIDLNVRAVVLVTGELLPLLRARGGAVITVASTAAFQPTPYLAVYGATKAFVLNWSLALHEELRGSGVSTLALCPGPTSTEFFQRAGLKEGSVPNMFGETSEKVVGVAMRALAAGKPLVVSGWKNQLMTAVVGVIPKRPMAWMAGIALRRFRMKQARP